MSVAVIELPAIIRSSTCKLLLYKMPSGAVKFNCPAVVVIELPDIDLTKPKLNKIGGTSGDSIHGISRISSMNAGNSYMVETPQIFGFADVIYD